MTLELDFDKHASRKFNTNSTPSAKPWNTKKAHPSSLTMCPVLFFQRAYFASP